MENNTNETIIRYTSVFKPREAIPYSKIAIWNRYFRSKVLLIATFVPTIAAIYFLLSDRNNPFWWLFVIIMFYPVFSFLGFLLKIYNHLKFRSPLDVAETEYTFMNNGILIDRRGAEKLDLMHWDDVNFLYEMKEYFLLFKSDTLVLVLIKKDMKEGQCDRIRKYILRHLPPAKSINYKKTLFF